VVRGDDGVQNLYYFSLARSYKHRGLNGHYLCVKQMPLNESIWLVLETCKIPMYYSDDRPYDPNK